MASTAMVRVGGAVAAGMLSAAGAAARLSMLHRTAAGGETMYMMSSRADAGVAVAAGYEAAGAMLQVQTLTSHRAVLMLTAMQQVAGVTMAMVARNPIMRMLLKTRQISLSAMHAAAGGAADVAAVDMIVKVQLQVTHTGPLMTDVQMVLAVRAAVAMLTCNAPVVTGADLTALERSGTRRPFSQAATQHISQMCTTPQTVVPAAMAAAVKVHVLLAATKMMQTAAPHLMLAAAAGAAGALALNHRARAA